jgi:hypothetical protein
MERRVGVEGMAWLTAGALVVLSCSSVALPDSGAGGARGASTGAGGMRSSMGGSPIFGAGSYTPGSCIQGQQNPDFNTGGACAPECQTVSCGRICTQDCCISCGIDATGSKICLCPDPSIRSFSTCTCSPPPGFPWGLHGGSCSPQGFASVAIPPGAPDGSMSLKGQPCKPTIVCFTADSLPTSERGCICQDDGDGTGAVMHCGAVNHWFVNDGSPETVWTP